MTSQQYERLTELFHAALEIAPNKRGTFLDHVTSGDAELRRELDSLIAAEIEARTEKPPNDIAAGYLARHDKDSATIPALILNRRLDRYQIISLLGKGGMGEVYLAQDTRLHRKVALKILPSDVALDQERMRRFEQEAQAAASLNHPNIAHIYEIGECEGTHFIAMEHIDGDTLRNKIHRDKTPLRNLLKYLIQVAEGLNKAHTAGIVHRDLKPDNIMIARDDYAKILDFGLAKLIDPTFRPGLSDEASGAYEKGSGQHSMTGMVMGTTGYMSPEQAHGRVDQIDHRSDIFSFGCILLESVTRERRFVDESVIKSAHGAARKDAAPSSDANSSAHPELQRIILRCLAKDRDDRYQTIKDVALDLKQVRQQTSPAQLDPASLSSINTVSEKQTTERRAASTSSVEYIATKIRRHKKSAAIILVVIAVSLLYGLFKLLTQNRLAPSPAIKITRLTATGNVFAGAISPDGKQLVYGVEDAGQQSIWVRETAGSGRVQILPPSESTYTSFTFSRDGKSLYFNMKDKNSSDSLYQMPAMGGKPRKVLDNISSRAALSSDNHNIAFIRGDTFDRENSVIVANSDGSGERLLATREGPDNFSGGIAWNPDRQSITCVAGSHGEKIIQVPINGGAEKSVKTPKWFAVVALEWLPDGSGLIVTVMEQTRSAPLQIWYLSYPDGEARRITNDFSNYLGVSLAANGNSLVAIQRERTAHIWVAPHGDASRAKQLTTGSGREDGYPAVDWTQDGRIIYDSTASGNRHTWIMNADGTDQRQLTDGPYEDQGAHVSRDGRYIVFASNRNGTQDIYRMDIDGSNVKQLTSETSAAAGPFFSPDGKSVIYNFRNSSWKLPAEGGEPVKLTNGSWTSSISPDGNLLAHVRLSGFGASYWKLSISAFAGGPPIKTFDVISDSRPNSRWTPDGKAITYSITQGSVFSGVTNVWSQSLTGGPPRQLTNFASENFFSFDWSREGSLVCGRGTTNSDAVLINFR